MYQYPIYISDYGDTSKTRKLYFFANELRQKRAINIRVRKPSVKYTDSAATSKKAEDDLS